MEPLRQLKQVNVLTTDAFFEIKRAVEFLKIFNEAHNNKLVNDNIAKLEQLIEEVTI